MNVKGLINQTDIQISTGKKGIDRKIKDGYCGDLLSDVMANAPDGCIWLTIQAHPNIVAVAVLRDVAAIILCGGQSPDEKTVEAAERENMPILLWPGTAYELAGRLHEMGVGRH